MWFFNSIHRQKRRLSIFNLTINSIRVRCKRNNFKTWLKMRHIYSTQLLSKFLNDEILSNIPLFDIKTSTLKNVVSRNTDMHQHSLSRIDWNFEFFFQRSKSLRFKTIFFIPIHSSYQPVISIYFRWKVEIMLQIRSCFSKRINFSFN